MSSMSANKKPYDFFISHSRRSSTSQALAESLYVGGGGGGGEFPLALVDWLAQLGVSDDTRDEVLTWICGRNFGATTVEELEGLGDADVAHLVALMPRAKQPKAKLLFEAAAKPVATTSKAAAAKPVVAKAKEVRKRAKFLFDTPREVCAICFTARAS